MTSNFYTSQNCKYPFQEIAQSIHTGTKLPYNIKVVRGRATLGVSGIGGVVVIYDMQDSTKPIIFNPNSAVLNVGLIASTTITTAGLDTSLTVGVGATGSGVISNEIASAIPMANVNAGCAVKYGAIGGVGTNAVADNTVTFSQPYLANGAVETTAGVVDLTFLLLEC